MSTDWMWCYENPRQAADEIERLRADLIMCATHNKEAVAAEREACAKVIDSLPGRVDTINRGVAMAAIRSRGTE